MLLLTPAKVLTAAFKKYHYRFTGKFFLAHSVQF